MQPAWHCLSTRDAPGGADLVILTSCAATTARLIDASASRHWPRVRLCPLQRLGEPGLAREVAAVRGVLVHLPAHHDHRDDVLRLAALLAARGTAFAVLRDDDSADAAFASACNLPPSTLRRLRALLGSDRADAASALLTQFALAAGLSREAAR